jgi:hypothetical protein
VSVVKLSKAQIECLNYLYEHPGATYDTIPFRDSTFKALGRIGMVHNSLMMPRIGRVGLLAIGKIQ